ncbi:unnamed protein product [Meloidogyne enterolobii]|uniref:Uncharacterized protein n=2 Tax=Meloidogyne enterolobii TaxID=390850 RepID=A0ACB0ZZ95_MELEN|nr:unnamed protein product [Meloidogyne enterolobii]
MSRREFVRTQEWRYRAFREQKWTSTTSPQFYRPIAPPMVYPLENNRYERILEEQNYEEWEKRNNSNNSRLNSTMLCRSYEGKRKLVITLRELPIEQYTSHPIENTKYSLPSNQRQHKIRQQFRPPSKQREEEYPPPPPRPKQNILYEYTDTQKIGRRGSNSNSSSTNSSLRSVQKLPQQQKKQIYQQSQYHQKHPIFVESKNHQIIKEDEEEKIKNKEIKEKQQQPLLEEKEEDEKNKINTKTITEPEQEVINEQNGFRIRVEAKDFNDSDFRVYIDSYRVLALDGEHVEDNKNGTVTVKKLNRRWKLAEDVDLLSVRAYLAADGNVEISGDKLLNKEKQNIIEEGEEEGEEFGEEEEEKDNQQYMEIKKKNKNNNYQIEDNGRKEEEEEEEGRIVYQQQQPLQFNKDEWKINNGNEIYFK